MPSIREILRVNVTWLEPGEVATKSQLCLEHPYPHTVIPYYPTYCEEEDEGVEFTKSCEAPVPSKPVWRIDMETLVRAVHHHPSWDAAGNSIPGTFYLDENYKVSDPPVEMLVPVVLFDFDLPSTRESWLSYLVSSDGLEGVFNDDLVALQNIGWHEWRSGHATDYDRYGVTTTFHGLWTIQVGGGEDPDVDWWFEGLVDPQNVNGIQVLPQEKPARKSTLAHLSML